MDRAKEEPSSLDDSTRARRVRASTVLRAAVQSWLLLLGGLAVGLLFAPGLGPLEASPEATENGAADGGALAPWTEFLPPPIIAALVLLLFLSGFFSGSETAFFSINKLRLRAMRDDAAYTARLAAALMEQPGRLLTTILVGNVFINVLIGVLLGSRVELTFQHSVGLPPPAAYAAAIFLATGAIVFCGEIFPKVLAVSASEYFARAAAAPLVAADRILFPLREGVMRLTDAIFRVTRFHEHRAAPFITDEEFKSVLTETATQGVIEAGEQEMIEGILEFSSVQLKEILMPRPDVIAIPHTASVADALDLHREHEYSRMPVYEEDLDHISGVLVVKDVLPSFAKGELDQPVSKFARPAHFVPETMTVSQFVKEAQRRRSHLAVVVDEYGGTAGIVTLEDAIEEVVGDIFDENEQEEPAHTQISAGEYRVDGGMDLEDLSELVGAPLEDAEHETVAGFLMNHTDKVLEPGDTVEVDHVRFTVERCEGKRVSDVRVQLLPKPPEEDAAFRKGKEGAP